MESFFQPFKYLRDVDNDRDIGKKLRKNDDWENHFQRNSRLEIEQSFPISGEIKVKQRNELWKSTRFYFKHIIDFS